MTFMEALELASHHKFQYFHVNLTYMLETWTSPYQISTEYLLEIGGYLILLNFLHSFHEFNQLWPSRKNFTLYKLNWHRDLSNIRIFLVLLGRNFLLVIGDFTQIFSCLLCNSWITQMCAAQFIQTKKIIF